MKSVAELFDAKSARYNALLKTMEWRAFAYRAKEAAGFACQVCKRGGAGVELNVHHHAYSTARQPWEYEPDEIAVLCKPCHVEMHECLQAFRRHVFRHLTPASFRTLNGALAVGFANMDGLTLAQAIAALVSTPGAVERFGKGSR